MTSEIAIKKTETQFFPASTIGVVHQDGTELSARAKGVTVDLHFKLIGAGIYRPFSAEVHGGNHYVDIGLTFERKELIDMDGAFSLPAEVATMLRARGYKVSDDFI